MNQSQLVTAVRAAILSVNAGFNISEEETLDSTRIYFGDSFYSADGTVEVYPSEYYEGYTWEFRASEAYSGCKECNLISEALDRIL